MRIIFSGVKYKISLTTLYNAFNQIEYDPRQKLNNFWPRLKVGGLQTVREYNLPIRQTILKMLLYLVNQQTSHNL